jgi:hypothetical protein
VDPKRHHYLPQRYLSGFANAEGRIWVFDRQTGKLRRDTPLNTGVETRLYRFDDPAGQPQSLERFFSFLETKTWPTIDRLDQGHDPTSADRSILAFYTAFQFTRTPWFQRRIEAAVRALTWSVIAGLPDDEAVSSLLEAMHETGMENTPSRESLLSILPELRGGYEMPGWGRARMTVSLGMSIAGVLSKMSSQIAYAGDVGSFITTDTPVLFVAPPFATEPSLVTPGALKIVPLTQRTLLTFTDIGDRIEFYPPKRGIVDFMNATIASSAEHLIIGPSEELVREMSDPAVLQKQLE